MLCFYSYIRGLIIQLFAYVSAFSPPHQFILRSLLLFLWRGGCWCSQMFINIFNLNDVKKKKKKNSDNKFLLTITWLEKSEIGELIADRESHVSESLSLRQIICSVTSVDNTIRHKIECAEARKLVCRAISFLMLFPQSWRHRVYSPTNALNI